MIESLFGLFLMVAGGGDKSVDPTSVVIKGINQVNKMQKKKTEQSNVPIHDEVYLMTTDQIYNLGGQK